MAWLEIWWNKKHFSSILKDFQLPKLSQTWEYAFKANFVKFCIQIDRDLHEQVFYGID